MIARAVDRVGNAFRDEKIIPHADKELRETLN